MENFKLFLLILWLLFFLFLSYQIFRYYLYIKRLKQLQNSTLNPKYKNILKRIKLYNTLSDYEKKILNFKILRFIQEKKFIGIHLEINDEIKTLISFYACLPTIYYKYFCYPFLKYIYVYPHTIILNQKNNLNGIVSHETLLISGEAVGESVIIVWDEAKKEIYHNLGRNVIIHEFAHELDFEEGTIDGIPPIEKPLYKEWTKIMFKEYEKFTNKLSFNRFLGKYSLIDKYAATNKAEFFAVLSEYYFMKPCVLKKHFPDIYKELNKFYKVKTDVC